MSNNNKGGKGKGTTNTGTTASKEPRKNTGPRTSGTHSQTPVHGPPTTVPIETFRSFVQEVKRIAGQRDATDVATIVIEDTCKVLSCDRCSFFFVDGDFLDLVIAKGVDNIRLPKSSGIAGACATEGKLLNIPDAYKDSRFNQEFDKKSGYRTHQILAVPVTDPDNEIVGVLQCINKKNKQPFDGIDEELLRCLAAQVGVAIKYAYQLEQAQKATDQKNALIGYIRNMNNNTNVPSLLFTLNKAAGELLEADRCTFYAVNRQAHTLHLINTDAPIDIAFPMNKGIAGHVATTGEILNIKDAYEDPRFNPSFDKQTGYRTRSMLVMPVFGSDQDKLAKKAIAVVQLINKTDGMAVFTAEDQDILAVLLRFVGPILSTSNLFKHKIKKIEAAALKEPTAKLVRQPSREMVTTPKAVPEMVMEEGDNEEEPQWNNES